MLPISRKKRSNSTDKVILGAKANEVPVYFAFGAAKCLRVCGVFVAVELLTHLPVIVFCFLSLMFSSLIVLFLQKPFKAAKKLNNQQWLRVLINGLLLGVVWLFWAKGLQECGALRTVILEHSHICIAGLLGLFVQGKGTHHRRKRSSRGEMIFMVGLGLLLFHSVQHQPGGTTQNADVGELASGSGIIDEIGLVWGITLLISSSILSAVRQKFATKVAKDIGGSKRLHALSLLMSTMAFFPLVFLDFIGEAAFGADYDYSVISAGTLLKSLVAGALVVVLQFYSSTVAASHLKETVSNLIGLVVSFLFALFLNWWWFTSPLSLMDNEEHYSFIFMSWILAVIGLVEVTRTNSQAEASIAALPYNFFQEEASQVGVISLAWRSFSKAVLADDSLDDAYTRMPPIFQQSLCKEFSWENAFQGGKRLLRHISGSPDSRKIAIFLSINLLFMIVEIVVGFWTNSLGLISDAGHMFFDSAALFIGLFASFVSKWKPDRLYTYGYARYETICGFINAIFLVFIAVFIMTESLERLSEPPELSTGGLLTTSILGFCVNLVGLLFFHDHAHMGGGHGHDHHGHSHSNDNMHGVFLHVLADALGSLGVIISSLLIEYKGWYIADPLCSLMISVLILLSVYPLLRSTAMSLLLIVPEETASHFNAVLGEILCMPYVLGIREPQIWAQSSGHLVISLHIIVATDAIEQHIARNAEDSIRAHLPDVRNLTVQVYKSAVYYAMLESRKQVVLPLFWDYGTGSLVYTPDGLLSEEQKKMQVDQFTSGHWSHKFASCGGHGHSHGSHGHSHSSHGHSHDMNPSTPSSGHGHSHSSHAGHGHSHSSHFGHDHSHAEGSHQILNNGAPSSASVCVEHPHSHSHGGGQGHSHGAGGHGHSIGGHHNFSMAFTQQSGATSNHGHSHNFEVDPETHPTFRSPQL